LQDVAIL